MPPRLLAAGLALATLAAAGAASSQTLNDILRRSVEDALRNLPRPALPAPAPAPVPIPPQTVPQQTLPPAPQADPTQGGAPVATPSTPAPVAAPPVPAPPVAAPPVTAPPVAAPPAPPAPLPAVATPGAAPPPVAWLAGGVHGLETRVADGPRTIDLRTSTPPELEGRYLPQGALIVLANPHVPADRRFLDGIGAIACHPQGGLVIHASTRRWEPSPQRGPGREYVENGTGLWRVEPDGRVRPMWVPTGRQTDDVYSSCGVPTTFARIPAAGRGSEVAVERTGAVLVADSDRRAIVRLRPDGIVEHVAGGGPDFCTVNPTRRKPVAGLRDGPGRDALFSGELSIAADPRDGTIWVAENDRVEQSGPPNCALRRIDPATGTVSLVRGGRCPDMETVRTTGHLSVGYEQVALDGRGRPLLLGVDRARREGVGPAELIYTKLHRVDGEREELIARAAHGARFEPHGRLLAIGAGPDGAPLAFGSAQYADGGLVAATVGTQQRFAWRSPQGPTGQYVDGPRGQARMFDLRAFCTATDGKVYALTGRAIRRIDLATGAVDTWLH